MTFGDEVIGFSEVLADEEAVAPPVWEVNALNMPPPGTPATIVIRKWQEKTDGQAQH